MILMLFFNRRGELLVMREKIMLTLRKYELFTNH